MNKHVRKFLEVKAGELGVSPEDLISTKDIPLNPMELMGVPEGAKILSRAIINGEHIILNSDRDTDGMLSLAINVSALVAMGVPFEKLIIIQNERMYSNGFNDYALECIDKDPNVKRATVMVTSDHGSSDEVRYKELREKHPHIQMLITDHHLYEEKPTTPEVFINPQQEGSDPKFKVLSGGVVTWCLMQATAMQLNHLNVDWEALELTRILGAITTVCDQMDMTSGINRTFVRNGVELFNSTQDHRFKSVKTAMRISKVTDRDMSYKIGPMVNACGRLNFATIGSGMFFPSDDKKATRALIELGIQKNNERKIKQAKYALQIERIFPRHVRNRTAVIALTNGDDIGGIAGPLASTILNKENVATVIFYKTPDGSLAGSSRAPNGFHLEETFKIINKIDPSIFIRFGGHGGAAGLQIRNSKLALFRDLFEKHLVTVDVKTSRMSIIDIPEGELTDDVVTGIDALAPFGNHWKEPLIRTPLTVRSRFEIKPKGAKVAEHASYGFSNNVVGFDFKGGLDHKGMHYAIVVGSVSRKNNRYGQAVDVFINEMTQDTKKIKKEYLNVNV